MGEHRSRPGNALRCFFLKISPYTPIDSSNRPLACLWLDDGNNVGNLTRLCCAYDIPGTVVAKQLQCVSRGASIRLLNALRDERASLTRRALILSFDHIFTPLCSTFGDVSPLLHTRVQYPRVVHRAEAVSVGELHLCFALSSLHTAALNEKLDFGQQHMRGKSATMWRARIVDRTRRHHCKVTNRKCFNCTSLRCTHFN